MKRLTAPSWRSRYRRPVALLSSSALVAGVAVSALATAAHAAPGCDVKYSANSWNTGFSANLIVTNLGDALTNWKLEFDYAGNQQAGAAWNGRLTQSGKHVSITNETWNASFPKGGSLYPGFNGTYSGTNASPTAFTLNGVLCTGVVTPTTTPVTPTTTPVTPTTTPVTPTTTPVTPTTTPVTPTTTPVTPTTTPVTPTTTPVTPTTTVNPGTNAYDARFEVMYAKLHAANSGYFSPEGIPYHSIETLMVEAPDQGHETTSEAISYYMWIEATHGRITGDWAGYNQAWSIAEKYLIPTHADQPTNSGYNASSPAQYAPESDSQSDYPVTLDKNVPTGADPIAGELKSAYGTDDVYGMHWIIDVDNVYGFGKCGDGTTRPAFINTFQRGSSESTWETIPQPSCDTLKFGGPNGFLDLFTKQDGAAAKQWKYTDAPDADARAVQAAFWADKWATAQGKKSSVASSVSKAAKMGDYLRYAFFDKYFKKIGNCTSPTTCPGASGRDAEHYLISWYYAWGGSLDTGGPWAWRIGDGAAHQGYQNPIAAYALSTVPALKPLSATGQSDWAKSLTRQIEFYTWLQSSEGGIAGGATNSWQGAYKAPPAGTPTFYGMAYDYEPVWHDPPSNRWFGFQAWSMERVAEYYYVTGDAKAKAILDKWVTWALANSDVDASGQFHIPNDLSWTGAPATWNAASPAANTSLHVSVDNKSTDIGVAGSYAKVLTYYAAKSGNAAAKTYAKSLLDGIWAKNQDAKGVGVPETRTDYSRFNEKVYVPSGWTGTMPNGDPINASSTFLSIRTWYKKDPDWPKVQAYLDGGPAPTFTYHRFWAQSDVATAMAVFGELFPNDGTTVPVTPTTTPVTPTTTPVTPTTTPVTPTTTPVTPTTTPVTPTTTPVTPTTTPVTPTTTPVTPTTTPVTPTTTPVTPTTTPVTPTTTPATTGAAYDARFETMYAKLHAANSGYFSPEGIPYHSIETLMVEAPDQGHETTSEAISYYMWIEATHGRITGDWAGYNQAWSIAEKYLIPTHADQPTNSGYNASSPAQYAPESDSQSDYPVTLDKNVPTGADPIAGELKSAYGTDDVYGMHWIIDVDNVYGFGKCGDGTTRPAFINTFQRGSSESTWETIPQPSCDTLKFGGPNGFLDLFTKQDGAAAKQWKYTDAPDADARAVQAAFWADKWATAQGKKSSVASSVSKAAKMGDYLRYAFFDKYFKKIGNCTSPTTCPGASGRDAEHYLISWYYAWGGSLDTGGPWAWRIGDGAAHQGYQNPIAAYALSTVPALKPLSATGQSDWAKSLTRQIEFYTWLQSSEGGIAGGATNSWQGAYKAPPAGTPTFYGMAYDYEPVWHDPPSNRWFGFQAWSMERVAEYYYVTGDAKAKAILDKWVTWALANSDVDASGQFHIPNDLSWTGAPATWNAASPAANTSLHVSVDNKSTDIGVAGSYAKVLTYYAAKSGNAAAKTYAKSLLDGIWAKNQDAKGVGVPETRTDYSRFNEKVYVPSGWTGTMPNGDPINASSTFLSIRTWYKKDPDWPKVQAYLDGGPAPTFTYHRFWAQSDVATAMAVFGEMFPNG